MEIRKYRPEDLREILELFYNTVHSVNAADYSPEQLDVWAPPSPDSAISTPLDNLTVSTSGTTASG